MCRNRAQCCLMGTQRCRNDSQIGLSAANKKMNCQIIISANLTDFGCRLLAVSVFTVTGSLLKICLNQLFKDFAVAALAVIVVKINHVFSSISSIL